MRTISFLIVIVFVFSACEGGKNENTNKNTFSNPEVEHFKQARQEYMQSKIDSAVLIYDLAIKDIKEGKKKEEVIEAYELKAAKLSQLAAVAFNEMTKALERKKVSQEEYDSFMEGIKLKSIKERSNNLRELGVEFNLKRTI